MRAVLQLSTTKPSRMAVARRCLAWCGIAAACIAVATFQPPAQSEAQASVAERKVNYGRLSPGHYRFLVRAVRWDGVASAKPASVGFTIVPPVSERWRLRVLVLMLAATICALYRYRVRSFLEMQRLRTRIATDLHDDIGSTLSQIAILSEVAKRGVCEQAELEPLSEIADLSRESVDSMSDIVWAIDPEQDRLGDLKVRMRRFSSDLFSGNGVRVQFRTPVEEQDPEIDSDKRRQIFLIFKESLHNTARHSACTEVEIDFHLEKGWLMLILRDNGKGFEMAHRSNGHGVTSMNQRAAELGGAVAVDSMPGCGTTVRMRVPLAEGLLPRWKEFLHKRVASI